MLVTGILTCNREEIAKSLEESILMLTLLVSIRGFFLLSPWLEVPILALRWEGKILYTQELKQPGWLQMSKATGLLESAGAIWQRAL